MRELRRWHRALYVESRYGKESISIGLFLVARSIDPTCLDVHAVDGEAGVGLPAADVGVLPLLREALGARLVAAVGEAAAEPAHLGADHPEAARPDRSRRELLSLCSH